MGPLTLTRCNALQSFPVSHLCEISVSISHMNTQGRKEHSFSKLIPDSRNVQVRGYRRVTGHEYKYFLVFCGLKSELHLMLLQPLRHICHYALACFILQQWQQTTTQCKFCKSKYRSDSVCLNWWILGRSPNEVNMFESESIKLK